MYPLKSKLTNQSFPLYSIETELKNQGFVIGPNWDYDHGSFDLLMANDGGYQYLRLPFNVISGSLDEKGAVIQFENPFLLTHVYNEGIDDVVEGGSLTSSFNQFQEPIDKDAKVPRKYQEKGLDILNTIEAILLT